MREVHSVGIDLGTLRSAVAVVVDGAPTVVADPRGFLHVPTVVAIAKHGRRLVGFAARHQAALNRENTVTGVRRLLGLHWSAGSTTELRQRLAFSIQPGALNEIRIWLRDRSYTPVEIGDLVVARLRAAAEEYLGAPVRNAVLTAPASFDRSRHRALFEIGREAEFEVVDVIEDPVAAAIGSGLWRPGAGVGEARPPSDGRQIVAVCDLGGTFECTLLELGRDRGSLRVLATADAPFIGGEELDRRLIAWLVEQTAAEHGVDLRQEALAVQRVSEAVEVAKHELSRAGEARIDLPLLLPGGPGPAVDLHRTVSRADLEACARDMVEQSLEVCDEALRRAGVDRRQVGTLLLVGAQAVMPLVQQMVSGYFDRAPHQGRAAADAVVCGAAQWAEWLARGEVRQRSDAGAARRRSGERARQSGRRDVGPPVQPPPSRPEPPSGADRRRHERQALVLKVQYPSQNDFLADYTLNISQGGMSVCTDQQLRVGEALDLELSFPGVLAPLSLSAAVRWIADAGDGDRTVGVQLTRREDRAGLQELVQRVTASDSRAADSRILRLLVVEDSGRFAALVDRARAERELRVETSSARDGQSALLRLDQRAYDAVLIDVGLPLMAGEALIRAIRADPRRSAMLLIAVGERAASHRATALDAGADFFLPRSVELSQLVETFSRLAAGPLTDGR